MSLFDFILSYLISRDPQMSQTYPLTLPQVLLDCVNVVFRSSARSWAAKLLHPSYCFFPALANCAAWFYFFQVIEFLYYGPEHNTTGASDSQVPPIPTSSHRYLSRTRHQHYRFPVLLRWNLQIKYYQRLARETS